MKLFLVISRMYQGAPFVSRRPVNFLYFWANSCHLWAAHPFFCLLPIFLSWAALLTLPGVFKGSHPPRFWYLGNHTIESISPTGHPYILVRESVILFIIYLIGFFLPSLSAISVFGLLSSMHIPLHIPTWYQSTDRNLNC